MRPIASSGACSISCACKASATRASNRQRLPDTRKPWSIYGIWSSRNNRSEKKALTAEDAEDTEENQKRGKNMCELKAGAVPKCPPMEGFYSRRYFLYSCLSSASSVVSVGL